MFYETHKAHGLKHDPFKSLIVPRPIAWVSTLSESGVVNLAPFSFFNAVTDAPPVVVIGIGGNHAEGGPKDTVANIRDTSEFVVNVVSWNLREQMNQTSAGVQRQIDEMRLAGVAAAPSELVKPPRVAAAPASLECLHLQTVELPSCIPGQNNLAIFGRVIGIHISNEIICDGLVDTKRFHPVARLGYHDYAVVRDVFTMQRPD
jgi:flavin reductase (DIM6/NTAB) family NADH-FMN oxidoreductase RutF